MRKYLTILLLVPFYAFAQNGETNILNNDGEICTVIYGSDNITVNNNFQYFLPEDEIKKVNKSLIEFIDKHDLLSEKERKIIEKELNVDAKIKNLNNRIKEYQIQISKIENIFERIDTTSSLSEEQLQSFSQIITLVKNATDNAKCLSEDYDFEEIQDSDGNIIHRIDRKILDADPNYIFVYPFHEDAAIVRQYEKFGFINSNGDIIVPMKYDYAEAFSEGKAIVGLETFDGMVYFFIDKLNKKITTDLKAAKPYKNGIAWVKAHLKKNEKTGFGVTWGSGTRQLLLNSKGEILKFKSNTWAIYDSLYLDNETWITIKSGKYGLVSDHGKLIHEPTFKSIGEKSNSFRAVQCVNGAWGFLNEKQDVYLRCLYNTAGDFIEERAIISVLSEGNEFWGIINKEGGKVVKPIFDKITRKSTEEFEVIKGSEVFKLNQYGVCINSASKKRKFKELFMHE